MGLGTISGTVTKRETGSTRISPSGAMTPVRNSMEEMWPSPVARRLMMKRRAPSGDAVWSGCGTMEGLNSAADSSAYSPREERADEKLARAGQRALGEDDVRSHLFVMRQQQRFDVEVPGVKFRGAPPRVLLRSLLLAQGEGAAEDLVTTGTVRRDERPDDDTRAFGQERHLVAANADGSHGTMGVGASIRCLGVVHFGEGKVEGQGRFGALVFVDAVVVQAVAAAAGAGIVERQAEIVAAQKPLEGALRLARPRSILRGAKGLEAGGDHGLRLHRLLVEVRARAVPLIRSRCCRWAGSARPGSSGSRPASATT